MTRSHGLCSFWGSLNTQRWDIDPTWTINGPRALMWGINNVRYEHFVITLIRHLLERDERDENAMKERWRWCNSHAITLLTAGFHSHWQYFNYSSLKDQPHNNDPFYIFCCDCFHYLRTMWLTSVCNTLGHIVSMNQTAAETEKAARSLPLVKISKDKILGSTWRKNPGINLATNLFQQAYGIQESRSTINQWAQPGPDMFI